MFIASFTPPLNAGGEKNAFNFASFLAEKGQQITLLSLNRKGKLKRRELIKKLRIVRLLYFNHNLFTKLISLFIILPGYLYYLAKNEVVFIYGGNIIGFELIILLGKILNKKIVFQSLLMREDDIETLVKKRFGGKIRKVILNQITIYFSLNPVFSEIWRKNYGSNKKIIESAQGVDTSIFFRINDDEKEKSRKKLRIPNNKLIIITVGYLIERKGFRGIFEILANLDFPFYYLVVGDYKVPKDHYMFHYNQEMKDLFDLSKTLLDGKVIFTGSKTNIQEYLNVADIFLFNSKIEGFPTNAVLESMACGLPCVAKEIIGIDNNITHRNKNILVGNRPEELAELLKKLNRKPEFRKKIGIAAAKTIQEKASFNVIWEKILTRL